jgi:hypothetical protein
VRDVRVKSIPMLDEAAKNAVPVGFKPALSNNKPVGCAACR